MIFFICCCVVIRVVAVLVMFCVLQVITLNYDHTLPVVSSHWFCFSALINNILSIFHSAFMIIIVILVSLQASAPVKWKEDYETETNNSVI